MQSVYAILMLDAIHYSVRDNGIVVKKAAYIAIGTDLEGHKDVLGIWVGATESSKYWLSVLNGPCPAGAGRPVHPLERQISAFGEVLAGQLAGAFYDIQIPA